MGKFLVKVYLGVTITIFGSCTTVLEAVRVMKVYKFQKIGIFYQFLSQKVNFAP